jgi:hypothetical protein
MAMKKSTRLAYRLALAVVVCGLSAGAAQAQSYGGSFTLTQEARWSGIALPAGQYSLAMDSVAGPLRVMDSSGRIRVLVYGSPEDPANGQPTALLVTRDGAGRTVRSLNCPAWGHKFVYTPFTRAERALIASAEQVETVPVRVASR